MQFNFFNWVRDGVKQAVLLGVTDAVDTIGTPLDGEDLNERLSAAMTTNLESSATKGGAKRKRLGRSLKDIDKSEN